jgi:hypothetical protein
MPAILACEHGLVPFVLDRENVFVPFKRTMEI